MMIHQLLHHLTPPPRGPESKEPLLYLYGIFNAEKYKNLWVKLECDWKLKHASLFSDEDLTVSMNNVAPYLVYMPISHPHITTLLKHYGHEGTLFFWSQEGFEDVLKRMRSLFEIRSDEGDNGYLAFYRPDHFTEMMKSNSPIKNLLFTKTDAWFCENELETNIVHKYTMHEHQVIQKNIKLKGEEL